MDYIVFIDIVSDVIILYHENREMIYQYIYILNWFNKTYIICLTDLQSNDTVSICSGNCRQVLGHKECLEITKIVQCVVQSITV